MNTFKISIDGKSRTVSPGQTILQVARQAGLTIPTLCHLEQCGPLTSCQVCLVKVVSEGRGRLVPSCATKVSPDMIIESETEEVHAARRTALELLFSDHVGDCLSPCQRLCPLQLNIPLMIREIQAGRFDEATLILRQSLPLAGVLARLCHHPCEQGCRRGDFDAPASIREMELVLTERDFKQGCRQAKIGVSRRAARGRQAVAIVGAGPVGLTAAHDLARYGYAVTVIDRNASGGGSLRKLGENELPGAALAAEMALLMEMGVHFRTGIELGNQVSVAGLRMGFDAILLAMGELTDEDWAKGEIPLARGVVKADPSTCLAAPPNIFAAGACVKPVKQIIRAMAEGRAAAGCIHRYLLGGEPRRPGKPFSSTMGRLEAGELREFLRTAGSEKIDAPCACHLDEGRAKQEAGRCLHCDCRSSGNCLLQHYAQIYGADASRFRSERQAFHQELQPGGIIFEPGKCIRCGICVKLSESGPGIGLAFVGRGFDVRVAAPFDHSIEEGMGAVVDECVRHCPTGALAYLEDHKNGRDGVI